LKKKKSPNLCTAGLPLRFALNRRRKLPFLYGGEVCSIHTRRGERNTILLSLTIVLPKVALSAICARFIVSQIAFQVQYSLFYHGGGYASNFAARV
jgi:hypothetical protein